MESRQYIQTILPLKIEWEPWYYTSCNVAVGSRVRVHFAGREYVAVVSALADSPSIDPSKVQPITGPAEGLEPITEPELKLWRFIADYYLCTAGEVYKAAYPAGKQVVEARRRRSKATISETPAGGVETEIQFGEEKPLLVLGPKREAAYKVMIDSTLKKGKDVLYLSPDFPAISYAEQRNLASEVRRTDIPGQLITGRKQLLFLPFSKLGLVIVDEEQDSSYKQDSPAPRYNARDVAIMLAHIHGAAAVLGSSCPSLESFLNAGSGKYSLFKTEQDPSPLSKAELIDTTAERRKRGMKKSFSIKLLQAMEEALQKKEHVLLLLPWADTRDTEIEARGFFPQARTRLKVSPLHRASSLEKYGLVALLNADFLFSRQDFRSDEKALQQLVRLAGKCTCPLLIQGADICARMEALDCPGLLAERRQFGLPPYKRLVEIKISDTNESRKAKMTAIIAKELGGLQIFLPKDRNLAAAKKDIAARISAIESEYSYSGHIHIDVDPL